MNMRAPSTYVVVAALCLALHNAVMILSDRAGSPLWLAVLLSFGIVAATGYALHGVFTFRQPLAMPGFARYVLAMSANVPLAFIFTWFWRDWTGLAMPVASPLASICMLAINFALSRWAIGAPKSTSVRNP